MTIKKPQRKNALASQKPEEKLKCLIAGKGSNDNNGDNNVKGESCVWTDSDVELLLNITREYEGNKTLENAI